MSDSASCHSFWDHYGKANAATPQQSSTPPILVKQGTLQPGASILPDQRLFNSYDFPGRAGQSLIITLESQDFAPYLQLLDSQGKKLATSGSAIRAIKQINSTIKITLTRDDTYRVIVTSHDAKGRGKYTLTVNNSDNFRCKIFLKTKIVDGKPFPDTVQYISQVKNDCGNSFTSRINTKENSATVVEDTDGGSVIHQFDDSPEQRVQVTTKYPDGGTQSFTIEPLDPSDPGTYRISITGRDGKTQTGTTTIPKKIRENIPPSLPSGNDANGEQAEDTTCKIARRFCGAVHAMSNDITNVELATVLSAAWNPFALPMLEILGLVDLGFSIYQDVCFGLVGGENTPVLPFEKLLKKLFATKFDNPLANDQVEAVYGKIKDKASEQAQLGDQLDEIRNAIGLSAFCAELKSASSSNDPHLVTFDGLRYDLQTVGEFTLIKSKYTAFEVQARQTPWNNSGSVSINSAIAMKVGSDRVALYAQGLPDTDITTPLRVNGKPTTIQGDKLVLPGGGEILRQGGTYIISAPTGEKVLASSNGSFLNISPFVYNSAGKYSGLLGNVNGNPKDDLQIRGGKNVLEARSTYGDVKQVLNLVGLRLPGALDRAEQGYFDQLYKQFANSWRVKQAESLFDYPPGKTTESYVNPGFPDNYLTLNMLSADQIQKAQNACTEAKVTPDLMEGCLFDVGFSGFSGFARATAEISGYIGIVNQLLPGLNIPTPEQAVEQVIEKVKPKVCLPFIGCV